MPYRMVIPVAVDQELVKRLLNGLYSGAKRKALKVVISSDGHYHVESKELRITIGLGPEPGGSIQSIHVHNEKQEAIVTAQDLESMQFTGLAKDVVAELKKNYSPVYHSLAENIVAFNRTYGGS